MATLAKDGHALHTLFVDGGNDVDSSRATHRADMAALAAGGQGVADDAARPDGVIARISGRAIAHMAESALQILAWRDYGRFLLLAAASAASLVFSQERAMRRLAASIALLLPCVAIGLIGASAAGPALQALGFPAAAAVFFNDPGRKGVVLFSARRWSEAAAAFGGDPANAYNRGNALAHAERYAEAIAAYEQALAANPDDEDAAFNKALLANLVDEKEAGGADAIAANSAATKARDTHDSPHADGKTGGSGDGFAGNQQGVSAPGAQGSSKAGKFDKGDVKSSDSAQGQGKGSAGDAGGAGGGAGELVDVAKMIRDLDRRTVHRRDAASVLPTVDWLSTLPDDPGQFLKLRILAEKARRKEHPAESSQDDDP
jgi:Ca-activated chloride channel family protein